MKKIQYFMIVVVGVTLLACGGSEPAVEESREAPPAAPGVTEDMTEANPAASESAPLDSKERPATQPPSAEPAAPAKAAPQAPATVPEAQQAAPQPAASQPQPVFAVLPEGTTLEVRLNESVSSEKNRQGDSFSATLENELVVDGKVVASKGSRVSGTLSEVQPSGKVQGRARLKMTLESITLGGTEYQIESSDITLEAEGSKGKDATMIGGGAGVGAVIGAITGGKKGAAIGGLIGAGAGTAGVLLTKGETVELPVEQLLGFRLERPVQVELP